ncbi:hypothetical protein LCL95_08590 [Bacillus timonensis]|nr:hypothetical protein [Bacillus timonensis]
MNMMFGMKKRKRNRGIMYSLLALGAGAAAYGVSRGMRGTEEKQENAFNEQLPDNPEIFNLLDQIKS